MRALWSLPKAAPALLRHLGAYAELAALDFARAQREISSIFVAVAIAAVCALFFLALVCLGVIAYFWDTPYRIMAICSLAAVFLIVTVIMVVYSRQLSRARSPLLSDLRREWQEDKVILEHALSSDEE